MAVPATRSVLIVEDDEALRDMVKELLADDGFTVVTASTLEAADRAINDENTYVYAVILDIGMPDGDGRDFCGMLRHQGHNMPIIMLTGMVGEEDVVRGLDSGAHDYVRKPFRTSELLARLRARLRDFENGEDATFSIGPYILSPGKKLLQDPTTKRRIPLTAKEAMILKVLYRSKPRPINRQSSCTTFGAIPQASAPTP